MELWTKHADGDWTPWPDLLRGLESLIDTPRGEVLLFTEAPDVDREALTAALRLIRTLADRVDVTVASPHPCSRLFEVVAPFHVDHFWLADSPHALGDVTEVLAPICPHLRTLTTRGVTVSACACHAGMVLARHHLDRWCLENDPECPHRQRNHA